jgi:hypothetical protein
MAVLFLLLYASLSVVLFLVARHASELTWTRYVYVYGAIEAVVFAAAGALFGTHVQREQTRQANERVTELEDEARRSTEDRQILERQWVAAKALRTAIEVKRHEIEEPPTTARRGTTGGLSADKVGSAAGQTAAPQARREDVLDELARFSEELFRGL